MKFPSKLERMLDAGAVIEWRPVKDFEGYYEVNNEGDVRSLARIDSKGRPVRGRILKPRTNIHGYLQVDLRKGQNKPQPQVHKLVMQAFVGPCPDGYQVNHRNEEKTDNRLDNLEYVTPKQNNNHGTATERRARARSFPVESFDPVTGEMIKRYPSMMEAERRDGYDHRRISKCLSGKQNTHQGVGFRKQTKITE